MQNVLIAGGAGFIGYHLCKSLLDSGYKVNSIDNYITGSEDNTRKLTSYPHFTFINHDITKGNQILSEKISSVEYIFHLASPASPNKKSPRSYIAYPIETMLVNSIGTYNLLEFAKEKGAKFLYTSSSEIYGDPAVSPQNEDYFGNVNPNGLRSVYDEGKRFGEAMTMGFVRKSNLDARIIRIFNTYGPYMQKDDGRVVSNFINQALINQDITIYGKGEQTRSLCYISDMVKGIQLAMFAPNTKGETMNIGNPDERTIKSLSEIIKNLVDSSSNIIFEELPADDPKSRRPDITKAKTLLGWEPVISLDKGLTETIAYFKQV